MDIYSYIRFVSHSQNLYFLCELVQLGFFQLVHSFFFIHLVLFSNMTNHMQLKHCAPVELIEPFLTHAAPKCYRSTELLEKPSGLKPVGSCCSCHGPTNETNRSRIEYQLNSLVYLSTALFGVALSLQLSIASWARRNALFVIFYNLRLKNNNRFVCDERVVFFDIQKRTTYIMRLFYFLWKVYKRVSLLANITILLNVPRLFSKPPIFFFFTAMA